MPKRWIEENIPEEYKGIIEEAEPASVIMTTQVVCLYLVHKSYVAKKNIIEYEGVKKLKDILNSNFKDIQFTVQDILKFLNVELWTKGDEIREILHRLVCLGFLKKTKLITTLQNVKEKYAYVFKIADHEEPCSYIKNNKCTYNDWEKKEMKVL